MLKRLFRKSSLESVDMFVYFETSKIEKRKAWRFLSFDVAFISCKNPELSSSDYAHNRTNDSSSHNSLSIYCNQQIFERCKRQTFVDNSLLMEVWIVVIS